MIGQDVQGGEYARSISIKHLGIPGEHEEVGAKFPPFLGW